MPININVPNLPYASIENPQIDFSALAQIGTIPERLRMRDLRNKFASGEITDYDSMVKALGAVDPIAAARVWAASREADALAQYRTATLNAKTEPSWEEKLIAPYLPQSGPSYLGPVDTTEAAVAAEEAEAAGTSVPGISTYGRPDLRNAPKKVQDILAPAGKIKEWEAEGTRQGDRNSQRAALQEAGPVLQKIFSQAVANVQAMDPDTIANALGPLQGADDPNTWQEAIGTRGAQTFGSLLNYMQHTQGQGLEGLTKPVDELPGGLTSTVRDNVKQVQASIINQLQRVQRVPGIGQQSDRELQQIIDQVGKLQNARTKGDLLERIASLATLLNDSGIPVTMPSIEDVSGLRPTKSVTEQYRNPPEAAQAGVGGHVVRSVPTETIPAPVQENTIVGGENIGTTGRQPRQATPGEIDSLRRSLDKYRDDPTNPAVRKIIENFDRLIGQPGSAEFYLTRSR